MESGEIQKEYILVPKELLEEILQALQEARKYLNEEKRKEARFYLQASSTSPQ